MIRFVSLAFRSLEPSLPAVDDPQEQARLEDVYQSAGIHLRRAALTYLREREPEVFRTILYSAVRFAESAITQGQEAEFRIVRPRQADTFWGAVTNANVLSAYQKLTQDLASMWRGAKSTRTPSTHSHFVSREGRYGLNQKEGAARRRAIITTRADAVLEKAPELLDAEVLRLRPLTKEQVTRWVRDEKTLAGVVQRLLGYLLNKKPRTIRLMLNQSRKQDTSAREFLAVLDHQQGRGKVEG